MQHKAEFHAKRRQTEVVLEFPMAELPEPPEPQQPASPSPTSRSARDSDGATNLLDALDARSDRFFQRNFQFSNRFSFIQKKKEMILLGGIRARVWHRDPRAKNLGQKRSTKNRWRLNLTRSKYHRQKQKNTDHLNLETLWCALIWTPFFVLARKAGNQKIIKEHIYAWPPEASQRRPQQPPRPCPTRRPCTTRRPCPIHRPRQPRPNPASRLQPRRRVLPVFRQNKTVVHCHIREKRRMRKI